jgi:hypothetical protein
MSQSTAVSLADRAASIALDATWRQWGPLNPMLAGDTTQQIRSVIDPEALVLATVGLWEHERRLVDVAAWWANTGATLLSVHRARALTKQFPDLTKAAIDEFAHLASQAGVRAWKPQGESELETEPRAGKGPTDLRLVSPPTLLLRLRAAMSGGAKTDTLAFLICQQGAWAGVKEIHQAIGYSLPNVRGAASDLVLAGFAEASDGYPVEYGATSRFARGFVELLYGEGAEVPPWQHWSHVYAFLLTVASWDTSQGRLANRYVASTAARKLYQEYRWLFRFHGIDAPDPNRYPGERFLDAFEDTLRALESWAREAL